MALKRPVQPQLAWMGVARWWVAAGSLHFLLMASAPVRAQPVDEQVTAERAESAHERDAPVDQSDAAGAADGPGSDTGSGVAAPSNAESEPESSAGESGGVTPEPKFEIQTALERARSLYQEGRFERCRQAYAETLERPESKALESVVLEQVRITLAACLLAVGEPELAESAIRDALRANPLMSSPDPVEFPSQVRDLFFTVKSSFLERVRRAQELKLQEAGRITQAKEAKVRRERARVRALEKLARSESLVRVNRRWVAALPFGVGQFQNGSPSAGTFFLISEVLALGTAAAAISVQQGTHVSADAGRRVNAGNQARYGQVLSTAYAFQWGGLGALALLSTIGIIEAQYSFVPEAALGSRPRKVPKGPAGIGLEPTVAPVESGAVVGVAGRF